MSEEIGCDKYCSFFSTRECVHVHMYVCHGDVLPTSNRHKINMTTPESALTPHGFNAGSEVKKSKQTKKVELGLNSRLDTG